jgi:H+-transporting ATPase
LAWFLINDRVKLLAYRIFDPSKPSLLAKKPPVDLTQQIAARAYELYQQRLQGETQQDQDWLEAERETRGSPAVHPKVA